MSKYTIDVFAKGNESEFAEQTYFANEAYEVADILHNCTRQKAGIKKLVVWIEEPDDREPIDTEEAGGYLEDK